MIEYEKGSRPEILEVLFDTDHRLFIHPVTVSEYLYHLIGFRGGKSPLTIKGAQGIERVLQDHKTEQFLQIFEHLPFSFDQDLNSIRLMKKYNLLPNDAMIIAAAAKEGFGFIASFDSDFKFPCQSEGIQLISDLSDIPILE